MPLAQHQEEVKYLQGDVTRLRDKLALAERDLAVSRELQVGTSTRYWVLLRAPIACTSRQHCR